MKIKNILNNKTVKIMLSIIAGILILYNIIFVVNEIITNNNYINIFGVNISIIQDDTMKSTIGRNSLIFSVKKDVNKINKGDIIALQSNSNLKLRRVTNIINNEEVQFVVKGDNNYFNDVQYISNEEYAGKVVFTIPIIGILFRVFQSKIITVIILFLIIYMIEMTRRKKIRRQKTRKIRKSIKQEENL